MSKQQFLDDTLNPGEICAGLILGEDDAPDHHLILLPGEAEKVNFKAAQAWAKKAGGDLPTRREQSLLFANAKAAFKPSWYWSGEQHASDASCAWGQNFLYGSQSTYRVSYECRARSVRRLVLL
jgi:hypothetical protein